MKKILGVVKNLDLFAKPIGLTYKGKSQYSTLCGGCFSLGIILTFIIYAGIYLKDLLLDPVLTGNSQKLYFSLSENTIAYNITTTDSTLAVQLYDGANDYGANVTEMNKYV